jgi:hypothetical protein
MVQEIFVEAWAPVESFTERVEEFALMHHGGRPEYE